MCAYVGRMKTFFGTTTLILFSTDDHEHLYVSSGEVAKYWFSNMISVN